ncbi:MAG: class I SAM-dependent methyltransferase [Pseudomonadota bacterium]|nr:class I SAM-dependent methyltransferase [Pseudomonadota bacterium]
MLIDFERSIFDRSAYEQGRGYAERVRLSNSLGARLHRRLMGENVVATPCTAILLEHVRTLSRNPRVLVIGGGTVGSGVEALYDAEDVTVVGFDVYASPQTLLVADGHDLPFRDGVFDGVLIQAVLEHVLDPWRVVAEIYRVLKPEGGVYANTPFMQQVHEGAYDFTRFTLSGHRWLFRNFHEIASGASAGVGTSAIWSVRYLLRAVGVPSRMVNALALSLFFLKRADRTKRRRENADGASGVYFVGTKADRPIGPKEMVEFYHRQGTTPSVETLASGLSRKTHG